MRKKLSPLVEAMKQYESLDERDRQTLADWIKASQPGKPRKSAPSAGKKSSPKGGETKSTQNIPTETGGAGTVTIKGPAPGLAFPAGASED